MDDRTRRLLGLAGIVGTFGVWQLVSAIGLVPSTSLPPAADCLARLGRLLGEGRTWDQMGATVAQVGVSLLLCVTVAVPAGLVIGRHRVVEAYTRSSIDFFRSVPGVALIPLFVLFMGPTAAMAVLLAASVAVWPLLIAAIEGARAVDPLAMEVAKAYRVGRTRTLAEVVLPASSPYIASGLRITAVTCLLVVTGTQLIASAPGIGQMMAVANVNGDVVGVYALAVLGGVLGLLLNVALRLGETRLLRWHQQSASYGGVV